MKPATAPPSLCITRSFPPPFGETVGQLGHIAAYVDGEGSSGAPRPGAPLGQPVGQSSGASATTDPLSPKHRLLVVESGIAPEVSVERGYRTITSGAELGRLGFAPSQRNVPALLIPIRNVTGEICTYQIRPDVPRVMKERTLKYESLKGARLCLDVPLRTMPHLRDPGRPLWITEGARKVDAAVSRGLACIGVQGVWGWRGTNEVGGKTALADFDSLALNDREVLVAYDSDVVTKPPVQMAMRRLADFLRMKGARVRVVVLPSGPGGTKTGLDDFFASGKSVDDALALVRDILPAVAEVETRAPSEYVETGSGIVWNRPVPDGYVPVPLCSFTARVKREILRDDDVATSLQLGIHARVGAVERTFTVDAREFPKLDWALEHLGVAAIVYTTHSAEKKVRVAIQTLSRDTVERVTVYVHVGWRRIDEAWAYLHAGGAIGAEGLRDDVRVALPEALDAFHLPAPVMGPSLVDDVRASLDLLQLAPQRIMMPLVAAVWRSLVKESDLFLLLVGRSNVFKSELAALIQQHVGAGFNARNLPASFGGTGNSLEAIAFTMKDAPCVIDDLAPTGSQADVARMHGLAERLGRAQGNRAGRSRCTTDGSLRPDRPPRGLMLWTGEDAPRGHSVKTRGMLLEVKSGDVDVGRLTVAQGHASSGAYARATSSYLSWLAPKRDAVLAAWSADVQALRQAVEGASTYRRVASNVAELVLGMRLFLRFALESGAIGQVEHDQLHGDVLTTCMDVAARQQARLAAESPAERFLELLRAAITSRQAHVARRGSDDPPEEPGAWGWRLERSTSDDRGDSTRWLSGGSCVGWVDGSDLYLDTKSAHQAVQRFSGATGEALSVDAETLKGRLHEAGLLHRTEKDGHLEVKVVIGGRRMRVLHLKTETLFASAEDSLSAATPDAVTPVVPAASGACPTCGARDAESGLAENGCLDCRAALAQERRSS